MKSTQPVLLLHPLCLKKPPAVLYSQAAFVASRDAPAVLGGMVADALSRHPRMSDSEAVALELALTLVRNLLAIPDSMVGGPPCALGRGPEGKMGLGLGA